MQEFVSSRAFGESKAREVASQILSDVKARGFAAVQEYSRKLDGFELEKTNVFATKEEIESACAMLTAEQERAMRKMQGRIESFARIQKSKMGKVSQKTADGSTSLEFVPVARAGIYVPAGRAPLFSSLFMAAVPARVAGVEEIAVFSPPQKDGKISPIILAAARMCGIEKVCKIGGAQAIGAMAYGIEGLFKPFDVICGPGNAYVSAAKQLACADGIRIDVPAGPSEVLVIANSTANTSFVAADMLAQAEHGSDSATICICTSQETAGEICKELELQLDSLPAKTPVRASIEKWGRVFVAKSIEEAIKAANQIAPEHLELFVKDAKRWLPKVKNAGAVFISTAEAFCDYGMGGGNHILPTSGAAKAWGGVSVQTFGKWMYVEELGAKAQEKLAKTAALLARMEGLEAHARASEIRKLGRGVKKWEK
ncbi:MAG: histidinol dehydrogenase [Candidatus Micrarchaeota archaeon]|nr:histidinol dehydrogenase [Candidatus Micrarchaeota archaeon]